MAWEIELSSLAQKNLAQLDQQVTRRVLVFLHERVTKLDDPRSIGEALKGSKLGALWKYRVGDFRIIANIQDNVLTVTVVRVGNRREVYRG